MASWRVSTLIAVTCLGLGMAGCGDGAPTLSEYADEVEPMMAQMQSRIIATDDALLQPVASPSQREASWRERVTARNEFLAGLEAIDPPDEAEELHAAAQDVVRRLAATEQGVADEIAGYENLSQLNDLTSTAAYREFIEMNDEATDICLAAQGMFDETEQREILADMPWIPGEMTEVVKVVFGCVPGEQ